MIVFQIWCKGQHETTILDWPVLPRVGDEIATRDYANRVQRYKVTGITHEIDNGVQDKPSIRVYCKT